MKTVEKIKNLYYAAFGNTNVIEIAKARDIEIDWILEAGCHDGTDTVELARAFEPNRYLAFEPDPAAREEASKRFKLEKLKDIELYPVGLSNEETSVYLKYEAEGKGSGSTHFSNVGEDLVRICRFDANYSIEEKNGLLWLDVEGHAMQALEGMMNSLHAFAIARVEVQLHTRNKDFVRDFKKVITYMNKGSLIPVFGPIHPSFFGDIVFVRASLLPFRDQIRSRILLFHMYLFHMILFPLLRKPR